MNPLLIIGGLGILGFALMGYKKKTKSVLPDRPRYEGSPSDPDDPWRLMRVPGRLA